MSIRPALLAAVALLASNPVFADAEQGAFYGFELGKVCVSDRVASEIRLIDGQRNKVVPPYFTGLTKPDEIQDVMQVCTPASNKLYEIAGCTAPLEGTDSDDYLATVRDQLKTRYPDWEEKAAGDNAFALVNLNYQIVGSKDERNAACIRYSYNPDSSRAILLRSQLEREQADNPMLDGM